MIANNNITGIILAGGQSLRMGTDKGFLKWKDKLFMEHIIVAIQPLVSEIFFVSNDEKYDSFKTKRIKDVIENAGPLAGIYSGLKASRTEYNLVLSCDIPLINSIILQQLIDAIDEKTNIIQFQSQGKAMPLIALYKKHCEHQFLKVLNQGERRLRIAVATCKVKTIILDTENEIYTANINTRQQLKEISNANNN